MNNDTNKIPRSVVDVTPVQVKVASLVADGVPLDRITDLTGVPADTAIAWSVWHFGFQAEVLAREAMASRLERNSCRKVRRLRADAQADALGTAAELGLPGAVIVTGPPPTPIPYAPPPEPPPTAWTLLRRAADAEIADQEREGTQRNARRSMPVPGFDNRDPRAVMVDIAERHATQLAQRPERSTP